MRHTRYITAAGLAALTALALAPDALAHGNPNENVSAGGGAILQIVFGTLAGIVAAGIATWVIVGHREGRISLLRNLGAFGERVSGLPGWVAVPMATHAAGLMIAVFGMYWDIAIHIDNGRDPGPFANAAHYFILVGLGTIFLAGALACTMPDRRPSDTAVRLPRGLQAPLGGVLILVCAAVALSAFPLDDMWHRIFGQDVTLWGPTHLLLFGGAALTVIGGFVLLIEGRRAMPLEQVTSRSARRLRRVQVVGFAGAFLIALSTFQGEFDYAVPQFRLVFHPILLMLAAAGALTAVRVHLGRGGALMAVAFFLVVRGLLSLFVSPVFGHTTLHFPLYIVEAVMVELVALRIDPRRTVAFGVAAGAAVGTFGLAAEWAWSHIWWTVEWPSTLLPEAAIAGFIAAVGAGVIGARAGRAVTAEPGLPPVSRWATPLAALAVIGVIAYATPVSEGKPKVIADVTTRDLIAGKERAVEVTARLHPANAADDATWFVITAWQGKEGRSVVSPMKKIAPGVWRSQEPLPVHGTWKSTLRLARGSAIDGMAVYFPPDRAIPVKGVPASAHFTRPFVRDKKLLQREQKPNAPAVLSLLAYVIVLLIALALIGSIVAGLARLERITSQPGAKPVEREPLLAGAGAAGEEEPGRFVSP
ncbi:MAG: hypothetical protein QOE06_2907 [Thermoleophilaceae bacterium]|jgi:hypothetical protein|nr:hypothetical protein [Thermoleophilaceae bacterium]